MLSALSVILVALLSEPAALELEIALRDEQDRPLAGMLLVLDDGRIHPAPEGKRVEIEQRALRFQPPRLAVQVGSEVAFPNRDRVAHHVYSFSPGNRFELPLHRPGEAPARRFAHPGVVTIGCNIHDRMTAVLVVAPGPWFGFTDGEGRLRLALPPGHYRVRGLAPEETTLRDLGELVAGPATPPRVTLRRPRRASGEAP